MSDLSLPRNTLPHANAGHLLDKVSIRRTKARISVLTVLLASRRAMSHQDIQMSLTTMDRVTLYRALDCLIEAGLIHKIASDDRIFRYSVGLDQQDQNQGIQHQHAHFKCMQCARIFCLSAADDSDEPGSIRSLQQQLQATLLSTQKMGFQNQDIELTIKGRCADCLTPKNSEE